MEIALIGAAVVAVVLMDKKKTTPVADDVTVDHEGPREKPEVFLVKMNDDEDYWGKGNGAGGKTMKPSPPPETQVIVQ